MQYTEGNTTLRSKQFLCGSFPFSSLLHRPGLKTRRLFSHRTEKRQAWKSRVDKCHHMSGWGRAQVGHEIRSSNTHIRKWCWRKASVATRASVWAALWRGGETVSSLGYSHGVVRKTIWQAGRGWELSGYWTNGLGCKLLKQTYQDSSHWQGCGDIWFAWVLLAVCSMGFPNWRWACLYIYYFCFCLFF